MADELDLILSQVASCNLDIQSSSKRYEVTHKAESLLSKWDENDTIVDSMLRVGSYNNFYIWHLVRALFIELSILSSHFTNIFLVFRFLLFRPQQIIIML